jgi:hypothetical protein
VENIYCPICKTLLYPTYNFCPQCGFKLKGGEVEISTAKQIGVYLLSFFLPPLGLWPGIKYMMKGDAKAKKVGLVAVILTFLSIIITLWVSFGVFKTITSTISPSYDQTQIEELGL